MKVRRNKNTANTPRKRLSNDMGVHLSWLQVWLGHDTKKPYRGSVHQRCNTTSWRSLFWQPPTSNKTYVYGWQRQAASFKGNNCLPSKWSWYYSSMLSHKPGFESDRACLGNASPLYTGGWISTIEYVFPCTCEKMYVYIYNCIYLLEWINGYCVTLIEHYALYYAENKFHFDEMIMMMSPSY